MSGWKKLASAAAASSAGLNVEDVFSTYVWTSAGLSSIAIQNGIDLQNEGGLVWVKSRTNVEHHVWVDTERGKTKAIFSNLTNAQDTDSTAYMGSFNTDGFNTGESAPAGGTAGKDYASWTFRKAPKFFDIVEYTGNGSTSQTISHNLGSAPGMMIIKSTNNNYSWAVYHREMYETGHYSGSTDPTDFYMLLNGTGKPGYTTGSGFWGNTAPTATEFTVGDNALVNVSGGNFIAYLFAHNNSDGEFGPTGDQDIIKCGRYAGNNTIGHEIELGFEPQFLFLMEMDNNDNRRMFDIMRGMPMSPSDTKVLYPNLSNAEANNSAVFEPYQSGFRIQSFTLNTSGNGYAYVAIRRGPMAVPESATDVFAIDTLGSTGDGKEPGYRSGFPVDMSLWTIPSTTTDNYVFSRFTPGKGLITNSANSEANFASAQFDYQNGYYSSTSTASTQYSWMWRRAPNYFDVVAYEGTGSNQTIDHNLGIAPEMMWVKARSRNAQWIYYHSAIGNTGAMWINDIGDGVITDSTYWNNTSPSSTNFSLGNNYRVNQSGQDYIAYLFASVDGVSKVGSYTGDGTDGRTIDCGFSSGARFVLIKDTAANTPFQVYDSERGIVSGNDPLLELNNTNSEATGFDLLDPDSSGFQVNSTINYVNQSGRTYTFYAIA